MRMDLTWLVIINRPNLATFQRKPWHPKAGSTHPKSANGMLSPPRLVVPPYFFVAGQSPQKHLHFDFDLRVTLA